MKRGMIFALLPFVAALVLIGCSNGPADPQGQGRLTMYMTDSPASYDAVNVVVESVEVHTSGGGWVTINDSVRTFDLLTLRNGAMTVVGDAMLDAGHYTQIRLVLGAGCNVVVNGQQFSLTVPSNEIKLIHQFEIEAGTRYELLLDFDAARSIVFAGGTYILKPTVRVNPVALTGSISGSVQPASAMALVTAASNADTASSYAEVSGMFKLMGLPPGTYSVTVQATQGAYRDTTVTGIAVVAGQTTNIGTITLQSLPTFGKEVQ